MFELFTDPATLITGGLFAQRYLIRPLLGNHSPYAGWGTGELYCTASTRWYHRFFNYVEGCHKGHKYGPWRRGGSYVWWGP